MKSVDENILKKCARDLMFELKEEELNLAVNDFELYLQLFKHIDEIDDLNAYDEMHFPYTVEISNIRSDEIEEPIKRDLIISNAPNSNKDYIIIPRVVKK